MAGDFGATLLMILSFAATFLVARVLSRNFRERRSQRAREREEAIRRASESRQVRRARERKNRG